MQTYKVPAGEDILRACKNLVALAKTSGERASMLFNDLELSAEPSDPHGFQARTIADEYTDRHNKRVREQDKSLLDRVLQKIGPTKTLWITPLSTSVILWVVDDSKNWREEVAVIAESKGVSTEVALSQLLEHLELNASTPAA